MPYDHDHHYPIPQTPCSGPSLLPQKYGGEKEDPPPLSPYSKDQIHIQGPFDESDIELQVGHGQTSSLSWKERSLKVLRYCTIILLGLVSIEVFARIQGDFFQQSFMTHLTSEHRAPPGWHPGPPDAKDMESRLTFTITYPPNDDSTDSSQGQCSDTYCLDRIHAASKELDKSEGTGTITIPNYPTPCIGSSCPLDPPSVYHDDHRMITAVIVKEPGPGPGITSPPICVPPHCSPHPPPGHPYVYDNPDPGRSGYVDVQHTGSTFHIRTQSVGGTYTQDGPPRVTATSPPICVPPHCYPHPPPGRHDDQPQHDYRHYHHHHDEVISASNHYETPPIFVPPQCFPHSQSDGEIDHFGTDQHRHQHHNYDEDKTLGTDNQDQGLPHGCVPPYCFPTPDPHPPMWSEQDQDQDQDQDQTPPICVPTHCHQHHVDIDRATEVIEDNLAYPALIVETANLLEVDSTYRGSTSLIDEDTYIDDDDEESEDEDEDENEDDWDDDKPICMPPICVPPARSRPICVPPICVPPDDFDGDGTDQERGD